MAEAAGATTSGATYSAAIELLRKAELIAVLKAFADAGVEPLILKGAALAYWLYAFPGDRPRSDTDLLIPPVQRSAADIALRALGYQPIDQAGGPTVSSELTYRRFHLGRWHLVDLHWRLNSSPLLWGVIDYDAARSRAIAIPELGTSARALNVADSLLMACIHRASHFQAPMYGADGRAHYGDQPAWLEDIHRLAARMQNSDWEALIEAARQHRVRTLCLEGLRAARSALGTEIPDFVRDALRVTGSPEPSASFLFGASWVVKWHEFWALPRWRLRLRYVSEHAFPPEVYMRQKYASSGSAALPWLYLRRAIEGAEKLRHRGSTPSSS